MKLIFPKYIFKPSIAIILLFISFFIGSSYKSWKGYISNLELKNDNTEEGQYSTNVLNVQDENVTRIISFGYNSSSLEIELEAYMSKPGFIVIARTQKGSKDWVESEKSELLNGSTGKLTFNKEKIIKTGDTALMVLYHDNGDKFFNENDTLIASNYLIIK